MGDSDIIVGLATIVVFGVGAQWIGRRSGIPSLLLLLPAGSSRARRSDSSIPSNSSGTRSSPGSPSWSRCSCSRRRWDCACATCPVSRGPVLRLVTVGAAITFGGASAAVALLLGVRGDLALLLGAILVVSGPTVVGPLLTEVRPRDPSEAVLRWESIALDPIGATLGVVVLNLVLASGGGVHPALQMLARLGTGVGVGIAAAGILVFVMSRFLVSDEMEAAVALLFAVVAFAVAEVALSEAGLFATTTLGFIAANQDIVPTARIKGFGDTLEILIIGSLFIVLGALVKLDDLVHYAWQTTALVAFLVIVLRPLAVAVSLMGTKVTAHDRAFVGWIDPRGIVAAATAAQFSGSLADAHIAHTFLLPVVFGVIVGTGVVYAATAGAAARLLGVKRPPRGELPSSAMSPGCSRSPATSTDSMCRCSCSPRAAPGDDSPTDGLRAASILDDEASLATALEAATISQVVVAARPGPAVTLLTASLVEDLGRRHVLALSETSRPGARRITHASAHPFAPGTTRERISALTAAGATVEVLDHRPEGAGILLATVAPDGAVDLTPGAKPTPAGAKLIALVADPPPG